MMNYYQKDFHINKTGNYNKEFNQRCPVLRSC